MRKTNPKCVVCGKTIMIHYGGPKVTYKYFMGNYYCEKCMEETKKC